MYYIFFIHPSVDGHLGCVHVLAIVKSAAVSIAVHVFSWVMVFSEYLPSSGIARSYGSFIPRFLRNIHMFFIVIISIYIPINNGKGFPFLRTLPSIYCL